MLFNGFPGNYNTWSMQWYQVLTTWKWAWALKAQMSWGTITGVLQNISPSVLSVVFSILHIASPSEGHLSFLNSHLLHDILQEVIVPWCDILKYSSHLLYPKQLSKAVGENTCRSLCTGNPAWSPGEFSAEHHMTWAKFLSISSDKDGF